MFTLKKINFSEINGGARYVDGNEVSPEAINRPIEASAYAQDRADEALFKATTAMDKVNDSEMGKITISAYPIGSIYSSTSSTSPAELFGGTWQQETRYIEYSVWGSKVITLPNDDYAVHLITPTEVFNMFRDKYGISLNGSHIVTMNFSIWNGDSTANSGPLYCPMYNGSTYFEFRHGMTKGLPTRINFTFTWSGQDPKNYWKRVE